jgi:hypothetical protein
MSDTFPGHFACKHPAGTPIEPHVEKALTARFQEGSITCVGAHDTAKKTGLEPSALGQAIDLLEGRIQKCQLGLFGYAPNKKIVTSDHPVPPELRNAIQSALKNGCLTCADAWNIAARLSFPRLSIGNACEALGIKIVNCQLGAF